MVKVQKKQEENAHSGGSSCIRIRPVYFVFFLALAVVYHGISNPISPSRVASIAPNNATALTAEISQSFLRLKAGFSVADGLDEENTSGSDSSSPPSEERQPASSILQFGCTPLEKRLTQKAIPDAKTIIDATKCPDSSAWLNEFLSEASETEPFLFLNFGCNKGYDSLFLAETITRNTEVFNKQKWAEAIGIGHPGNCFQGASDNNIPIDPTLPKRPVEIHCIEAMPQTAEKLIHAAEVTSAKANGMYMYNYAMTGTPGGAPILFPNPTNKAGVENLGIGHCQRDATKHEHECKEVPTKTVDEFVEENVDNTRPGRRIPFISIDVEGFDASVIQGAKETLKRTDYLEFEYHGIGDWPAKKLKDVVEMLKGYGLVCYWAGVNQLWRMSDTCWQDHFEFHMWSNVACVSTQHQPKLAARMEQVFEDTLVQGAATTT